LTAAKEGNKTAPVNTVHPVHISRSASFRGFITSDC